MDDDEFGGNARQERVVQNNEPEEFLALFAGRLVVRDGGLTKTGVDTRDHGGVSLFQVKGQSALTVRAVQVAEEAKSLNSGDCFVLQGSWSGRQARHTASSDRRHRLRRLSHPGKPPNLPQMRRRYASHFRFWASCFTLLFPKSRNIMTSCFTNEADFPFLSQYLIY